MNQLPTIKDIFIFFKTSWKVIVASMLAFLLLYGGAVLYSQLTQSEIVEQETNRDSIVQGLTQEEYEDLKEDEVSFSFYVENADDTAFMNYNLLKTYFLSPEVWPSIQNELELDYDVLDYFVINISRDSTQALHLNIGTGDITDNMALANRIYTMIENNAFDFLEGKEVFLLTKPKRLIVEELDSETESSEIQPNTINYPLLALGGLAISFVFGVFAAVVWSFFKKEYTLTSLAHFNDAEKVVNLTHVKNEKNYTEYFLHSILHPKGTDKKVVLAQSNAEKIRNAIQNKDIIVVSSLLELTEIDSFEEVIIIIEQNITKKKWYHNQQVLLENYDVSRKIILL